MKHTTIKDIVSVQLTQDQIKTLIHLIPKDADGDALTLRQQELLNLLCSKFIEEKEEIISSLNPNA